MRDIPRGSIVKVGDRLYDIGDYMGNIGWTRETADHPWELSDAYCCPFPTVDPTSTWDIELDPPPEDTL